MSWSRFSSTSLARATQRPAYSSGHRLVIAFDAPGVTSTEREPRLHRKSDALALRGNGGGGGACGASACDGRDGDGGGGGAGPCSMSQDRSPFTTGCDVRRATAGRRQEGGDEKREADLTRCHTGSIGGGWDASSTAIRSPRAGRSQGRLGVFRRAAGVRCRNRRLCPPISRSSFELSSPRDGLGQDAAPNR